MLELRHRAVAVQERLQQRHHRIGTDAVTLSQIVDCPQALVGELGQGVIPSSDGDMTSRAE